MTDLTDTELNEAMALGVLWWTKCTQESHEGPGEKSLWGWNFCWRNPKTGLHHCETEMRWATSVDACLDDILRAVKRLYPRAEWQFRQINSRTRWRASFMNPPLHLENVDTEEPTLARAICLVARDVVKTHRAAPP